MDCGTKRLAATVIFANKLDNPAHAITLTEVMEYVKAAGFLKHDVPNPGQIRYLKEFFLPDLNEHRDDRCFAGLKTIPDGMT